MGEVEMISVKAKDYLALSNENERLNEENKRLRKMLGMPTTRKKAVKTELDRGLVPGDMQAIVSEWLKDKREKGQTYKPTGFKTFVDKLMKLSGGNVDVATQIIEESISNNWAGIFPLKNNAAKMPVGFVQTDNSQNKYKEQTLW